ncbi:MAG: hypothetical protein AAF430_07295 [Myxococcota bacterium]
MAAAGRNPLLLGVVVAALVGLAIEALCFGVLRWTGEAPHSLEEVRERQRALAEASALDPLDPAPQTNLERMMAADALHPYLGFVYDPDDWNSSEREGQHGGVPVSDFGFVDDKAPILPKSEERFVVGVFGGSVALQFGLDAVAALEAALDDSGALNGREVVVVRAALGSHKQPQQIQALAYLYALGAHFDAVINLDGFNEMALALENARKGVHPAYPRGWSLRVASVPEPGLQKLIGAKGLAEAERRAWAERWLALPLGRSSTAALVWKFRDRALARRAAALGLELQQFETESSALPYAARGPDAGLQGEEALYREVARIWAESSVQMARLAEANGALYAHFLQPNQYVPDSKPLSEEERRSAFDPRHPYRRGVHLGYPLLREAAAQLTEEGVLFEDLSALFAAVEATVYADTCCHFNATGLERLGRHVGESLGRALDAR